MVRDYIFNLKGSNYQGWNDWKKSVGFRIWVRTFGRGSDRKKPDFVSRISEEFMCG